jgi:hypothetical protein
LVSSGPRPADANTLNAVFDGVGWVAGALEPALITCSSTESVGTAARVRIGDSTAGVLVSVAGGAVGRGEGTTG